MAKCILFIAFSLASAAAGADDQSIPLISEGGDTAAQVKNYKEDINALTRLTRHRNVYVRECAIIWLGESKDAKATGVLLELASQWPENDLKPNYRTIGNALIHQRHFPSEKDLSAFLEGENLALAWFASKAVGAYKVNGLQRKLIDFVQNCPDDDTAWSAVGSFRKLGPLDSELDRLLRIAADPMKTRHYYFVNMIAVYRANDRVSELMLRLLDDKDRRVQRVGVDYLSQERIRTVPLLVKIGSLVDINSGELRYGVVAALEKATGISFGGTSWPGIESEETTRGDKEVSRKWKQWLHQNKDHIRYDEHTGRFTTMP